jgi:methylmalonyl-CoA mutase
MEAASNDKRLFPEFESVSAEAWKARITADLKGADYEKSLTRSTYEGITTQPFYTAAGGNNQSVTEAAPGNFPYARGKKTSGNTWLNTPLILADAGTGAALAKAREALNGGADALELYLPDADSLSVPELVSAIDLTKIPVQFHLSPASAGFATKLLQATAQAGIAPENLLCRFFYDPLTQSIAADAKNTGDSGQILSGGHSFLFPVSVNGASFYNSGASLVQEIAFTLSAATEYIHQLTESGKTADEALQGAIFRMAVGTNYFFEIAKLRALRLLWSAVVKSFGAAPETAATLRIQSVTSSWHQTLFDPQTNMLRATTEAMSAIIGGCDSLTILPYNSEIGATGNFSTRIARNISIILKEESYFGNVADPAAGSYYVESLTNDLAEKAWELFTETEAAGGYLQASKTGLIEEKIEAVKTEKHKNLARGKDKLVGTNQFANTLEKLPEELLNRMQVAAGNRASSAFDLLRMRTLKYYQSHGHVKIYLALLGTSSMRKVRADFVQDFLSLADFEAVMADTKNNPENFEPFAQASCVVLCAADEDYAAYTDTIAETLKATGKCNLVLLAGNPALLPSGLSLKGIDGFIYSGADAVEVLTNIQMRLGVI